MVTLVSLLTQSVPKEDALDGFGVQLRPIGLNNMNITITVKYFRKKRGHKR